MRTALATGDEHLQADQLVTTSIVHGERLNGTSIIAVTVAPPVAMPIVEKPWAARGGDLTQEDAAM